ncbi:hypothetical protein GGQ55_001643 [Geodermatophilus daqingensis]|uniref:Helicase XPB/Ssl2 N-terminal domain-containing protein n=2 Tax=Petropleomorpha daqingensis TaxID=2026353 RepID=A0A853CBI7_9ACTN|nr:hypothetical protein [Petropleomorpha daqingensis]
MEMALRALGGRPRGNKAEKVEALLAVLADPDRVRALVRLAPPSVAEGLRTMACTGTDEDDRYYFGEFRRHREAEQWAVAHGLLAGSTWGYTAPMPAEVALALRGGDYRAPFSPRPPVIRTHPVAPEAVESASAAAIGAFLSHALALLDRLTRVPVPLLAGGGVGVRELGRLAKALGVEDTEIRLLLALSAACRLLMPGTEGLGVGDRFDEWRREEPAAQAAQLITSWWAFPSAPTRSRDADGRTLPALRGQDPCAGCHAARVVLLHSASGLPAGQAADLADLAASARWHRPLIHVLTQDADAPLTTTWREAELLGVAAAGALSPLGAALLTDDENALVEHLTRLLPATSDTARFGSDLTALVSGTPSVRASTLLDSCADRESSGGAVIWRFSPTSIRRAMDEGTTADRLLHELADLAERELPQALTYLVHDVARRHGRLRLHAATSLIQSDDEALLAEVAVDKRLAKLGLTLLAPTVLACTVPLDVALARLREVGYFPVAEGVPAPPSPRGTAAARGQRTPAPRTVRPSPERADEGVLASRLLATPSIAVPEPTTWPLRELRALAPDLPLGQLALLSTALEVGGRVAITYRAASGAVTHRVISDPELIGAVVEAWCELRQDERVFSVSGMLSIAPAP